MAECGFFSSHPDLIARVKADREKDKDREEPLPSWHAVPFAAVGVIRFLHKVERLRREREEQADEGFAEESGCWDTLDEVGWHGKKKSRSKINTMHEEKTDLF